MKEYLLTEFEVTVEKLPKGIKMDEKSNVLTLNDSNENKTGFVAEEPAKECPQVGYNNSCDTKTLNIEQEKYNVLLEQRRQIIEGIDGNKKSFHTSIFSILTFVSANYITTIIAGENMPPLLVFVAIQVVMALGCYVLGLLVAMNNDRDMIRAIDKYIEENYGIDTFLFQGEMHYRIINRKSNFTFITGLSAGIVFIVFLGTVIVLRKEIWRFILCNPWWGVCFFVELIGIGIVVLNEYIYGRTGKSKIKDDCYDFLKRNIQDEM